MNERLIEPNQGEFLYIPKLNTWFAGTIQQEREGLIVINAISFSEIDNIYAENNTIPKFFVEFEKYEDTNPRYTKTHREIYDFLSSNLGRKTQFIILNNQNTNGNSNLGDFVINVFEENDEIEQYRFSLDYDLAVGTTNV